jgi:hypothetical protein
MRPFVPINLRDPVGAKIAAKIYDGILPHNIADFETKWLPELRKVYADDAKWDWAKKVRSTNKLLNFRAYAVECAGSTEGLMQLNLQHSSRLDGHQIAYIEYLHTAPWNRKELVNPPHLALVGISLIVQAIVSSKETGYGGRFALHSLPGATNWYRKKLDMVEFGSDDSAGGLIYFELTENKATELIDKFTG